MRKVAYAAIVSLVFANVVAWPYVVEGSDLRVTFFDVGQGDSIFIETPYRQQIVIDGGPSSAILEKLGQKMPFWDRTIDLIILTHPEKDHLTGLLDVLKRYKVENILWTGVVRDTAEYKEWEKLIKEEGAKIFLTPLTPDVERRLTSGVELEILSPLDNLEGKILKDSNDTSIVAKLIFGRVSFLFTGDITKSVEKELVDRGADIDSDVLKAAHHGSKTSTSKEFVAAVSPEIAVIQAGRNNSYGHPRQETLDTLAEYGIKIFRTDIDGDIKIISNGTTYAVSNF